MLRIDRPGGSNRLSLFLNERPEYNAWWSIHPYFDPHNFYSNMNNVSLKFMPSANMFARCPKKRIAIAGHEPFLGEDDDWKACVQRIRIKYSGNGPGSEAGPRQSIRARGTA